MIVLVPMTEEEFETYTQRSIAEYAEEHVRAGRWSAEEAYAEALSQHQELLPKGVATPNNYLFTLRDETTEEVVGMLWFAAQDQAGQRSAFVYDIAIDPAFRRRGYATQAFRAMEDRARELGLASIRLHVFGHNHEARALYEKLGYEPTNINMAKAL